MVNIFLLRPFKDECAESKNMIDAIITPSTVHLSFDEKKINKPGHSERPSVLTVCFYFFSVFPFLQLHF